MLPSHRIGIEYLDRVRVFVDGDRVVYARHRDGTSLIWNLPDKSMAVLLLGTGSSLTQEAARKLAESGVLVAFTGTGGTPLLMASQSEYRPTDRLRRWIALWQNPEARLAAAKAWHRLRVDRIEKLWPVLLKDTRLRPDIEDVLADYRDAVKGSRSVASLMGHEGRLTVTLYKQAARATGLTWAGRSERFDTDKDAANRFLDSGNYLAYGIAAFALWATGIPTGLAVSHGESRAGGLVFDLADTIKDAVILPQAFLSAAAGAERQEFRDQAIAALHDAEAIPVMFKAIDAALAAGERILENG